MKLLTIKECHRELKAMGHEIGLSFLYRLASSGDIKLRDGRTDPEAILHHLRCELAIPTAPAQPEGQHQHSGCRSDEPLRLRGRKAAKPSSDLSRRGGTAKQTLP